ncbi:MAG: hypothetical protein DCC75_08675 [Proteobacteria bacterium]|nr:MAG: hypothetical protein DCC75_08675 [Pseudomonadota bacterium]
MGVRVGVAVLVAVAVAVLVGVAVRVAVGERLLVLVGVAVRVGVRVAVLTAVTVAVGIFGALVGECVLVTVTAGGGVGDASAGGGKVGAAGVTEDLAPQQPANVKRSRFLPTLAAVRRSLRFIFESNLKSKLLQIGSLCKVPI